MQQIENQNQAPVIWDAPNFNGEVEKLREDIRNYFIERNIDHRCRVNVTRHGQWYELAGRVDSFWTRAVLFSLVPSTRTGRHIVDKLRVSGLLERSLESQESII